MVAPGLQPSALVLPGGGGQCTADPATGSASSFVDMSFYSDDINFTGNTTMVSSAAPAAAGGAGTGAAADDCGGAAPTTSRPAPRSAPSRSQRRALHHHFVRHARRMRRHRLRAIDLCSGGGGASLGYAAAGFDILAGVEFDKAKLAVFSRNHPGALPLLMDVTATDALYRKLRHFTDLDLVHCSPSCQPFSRAGVHDPNDPRIAVTPACVVLACRLRPKVIVMEQVPELLDFKGGALWRSCLDTFTSAGYTVALEKAVNAAHFAPQRRNRMFVVATLDGVEVPFTAAAAQLKQRPLVTLADTFPQWAADGFDSYFMQSRTSTGRCMHALDGQSPPLRTNCGSRTLTYKVRPNDAPFEFQRSRRPSIDELRTIMGWPEHAHLPANRRAAGVILGNSVCPLVSEWVGHVVSSGITQSAIRDDAASLVASLRGERELALTKAAVASTLPHLAVRAAAMAVEADRVLSYEQAVIDAAAASAAGAYVAPLPGSSSHQVAEMDARVPDTDVNGSGAVHVAQMRRRERLRLTKLLQARLRSDGTLRSVRDPVWNRPPLSSPPSSGNPAAMFAARPWRRASADGEPTHPCTVSQRWRRWQVAHMSHCERCQRHSASVHGTAPPLDALRSAFRTGIIPDASSWTLDPECYQRAMVDDVRVGLLPPRHPPPAAKNVRNGSSCWDEFPAVLDYMRKMDDINCLGDNEWELPPGAVCSALHAVVRPADLRAFHRDGVPYPVRTVLDLTGSDVNSTLPRWRFRMEGIDSAVALISSHSHCFIGKTDLSKYYPSLPLHAEYQRYVYIRDPRLDTQWRGVGPPSAEWLAHRAARSGRPRIGPYRRHTGLPLGLSLAPAFASALSGEMVQFLSSLGVSATMYVDDLLCCANSADECKRHMDIASSVFKWLGFKCNPDKQEGPARSLEYLGYVISTTDGTVTIGDDRRHELLAALRRMCRSTVETDDLESVIGKLSFAAGILRGARTYIYRLYCDLQAATARRDKSLTLSAGALLDVGWWLRLLQRSPPSSRIYREDEDVPVVTMKSDASGDKGWGYVFDGAISTGAASRGTWSRTATSSTRSSLPSCTLPRSTENDSAEKLCASALTTPASPTLC